MLTDLRGDDLLRKQMNASRACIIYHYAITNENIYVSYKDDIYVIKLVP